MHVEPPMERKIMRLETKFLRNALPCKQIPQEAKICAMAWTPFGLHRPLSYVWSYTQTATNVLKLNEFEWWARENSNL